jgi:hypothetical protein
MDALHAYALLVAVSVPVSTLLAMNVWLYLAGERDTLMLPGLRGWTAVEMTPPKAEESAPAPAPAAVAANEEPFRLAA